MKIGIVLPNVGKLGATKVFFEIKAASLEKVLDQARQFRKVG